MDQPSTRDAAIASALRHAARTGAVEGDCPDAGLVAAWQEGALPPEAAARMERHTASCTRCRAVLAAMASMDADTATDRNAAAASAEVSRFAGWRVWLRWLTPIAAAATAVAIWVASPESPGVPPTVTSDLQTAAPPPITGTAAERPDSATPPSSAAPTPPGLAEAERLSRDAGAAGGAEANVAAPAPDTTAAAAPPAPPPLPTPAARPDVQTEALGVSADARAATPPDRGGPPAPGRAVSQETRALRSAAPAAPGNAVPERRALAIDTVAAPPLVLVAPSGVVRWRVAGAAVERSTDGGRSWSTATMDMPRPVTSGAAVSDTVCWLAGPGGTVRRSVDGRAFRPVPFPDSSDLTAIAATSADEARVTTAAGRVFETADGGRTWRPASN